MYISDDINDYTVSTGEYLITPPCNNQHGWKSSLCEFYYFHFYADNAGCEFPSHGIYNDKYTLEKYYNILSHDRSMQTIHNHIIAALLLELKNGGHLEKPSNASEVCCLIEDYINIAPAEQLRVAFLSVKFKYNEKYLSQCFKQKMRIMLKKYLKNEIINRAKHMLIYTSMPISSIGEQLGYYDAHSFSIVFKNSEGISPKEYRNKMKNNNSV